MHKYGMKRSGANWLAITVPTPVTSMFTRLLHTPTIAVLCACDRYECVCASSVCLQCILPQGSLCVILFMGPCVWLDQLILSARERPRSKTCGGESDADSVATRRSASTGTQPPSPRALQRSDHYQKQIQVAVKK